MQKNVAGQKWTVFAFNRTTNVPQTGDAAQITAEISKDGAAGGGNIADANPTELEDGYYVFDIAIGESNADLLTLLPESSTGNIQVIGVPGTVYTTEPNRNKLSVDSNGRTDVIKVAGTTQTGNDNGADINAILEDTGTTLEDRQVTIAGDVVNIDGIVPAAVGDAMTLAADAIKKVTYDESTAWPLLAADVAATQIARVGADGDTLEVLSDEIAVVKAETALIVADTGELQIDDIPGKIATLDTVVDGVETKVDTAITDIAAVKAETVLIVADTGELQVDDIPTLIAALPTVDEIWAKAMQDLGAIPGATASALDALNILFMALRNKQTATSSAQTIRNNAGATIATATLADAAGTTTKEKYA